MKLFIKTPNTNSLKDFLTDFFKHKRNGFYHGDETYSDEKCTKLHCQLGKYRSLDDLMWLCNTYFPETNEKDILSNIVPFCFIRYCEHIDMPTINRGANNEYALHKATDSVYYNLYKHDYKGQSKYSIDSIISILKN